MTYVDRECKVLLRVHSNGCQNNILLHAGDSAIHPLRTRFYSPVLGRFLQRDPAPASPHLYDFLDGAPTSRYLDPLGLASQNLLPPSGSYPTSQPATLPTRTGLGPLAPPGSGGAGGTDIFNTSGGGQNCFGDSVCMPTWLDWPKLAPPSLPEDFSHAQHFVPTGCISVSCDPITEATTECDCNHPDELIVFLTSVPHSKDRYTDLNFHALGRNTSVLPAPWHTKQGAADKWVNVQDPLENLHALYPYTRDKKVTVKKLCFCCDRTKMNQPK